MRIRHGTAWLALAAAFAVAGCAPRASVEPSLTGGAVDGGERDAGPHQGHAWEVVLPGAGIAAGEDVAPWEANRIDLAYRPAPNVIEQTTWPPDRSPRLQDIRRLYLHDRPERIYFYYSAPRRHHSWHRY